VELRVDQADCTDASFSEAASALNGLPLFGEFHQCFIAERHRDDERERKDATLSA
jgi:hypothetical protein